MRWIEIEVGGVVGRERIPLESANDCERRTLELTSVLAGEDGATRQHKPRACLVDQIAGGKCCQTFKQS